MDQLNSVFSTLVFQKYLVYIIHMPFFQQNDHIMCNIAATFPVNSRSDESVEMPTIYNSHNHKFLYYPSFSISSFFSSSFFIFYLIMISTF